DTSNGNQVSAVSTVNFTDGTSELIEEVTFATAPAGNGPGSMSGFWNETPVPATNEGTPSTDGSARQPGSQQGFMFLSEDPASVTNGSSPQPSSQQGFMFLSQDPASLTDGSAPQPSSQQVFLSQDPTPVAGNGPGLLFGFWNETPVPATNEGT